jgi:hypothetical protein
MTADLYKILSGVRSSFPELDGLDMEIEWQPIDEGFVEYGEFEGSGFYFEIDSNTLIGAPDNVLRGGLAQMVCHAVRDYENSPAVAEGEDDHFDRNLTARMRIAFEVDTKVIRRGLGPDLLAFVKYVDTLGYKTEADDGITLDQLERIAESDFKI